MNKSGLKSLDKLGADPRVQEVYKDSDGIWVELHRGFKNTYDEPLGALHGIHEMNVRDVLRRVSGIAPCDCIDCRGVVRQ